VLRIAGRLLQVLRTVIFDVALPPAIKAKAPVEENAMTLAGAVRGMVCRACSGEYTYKVLPPLPRMKAFELSGENAAVVALLIFRGVVAAADELALTT